MWDLSCQDWETRLRGGKSLIPALPLDGKEAARAVGIFNKLHLPDVPGTPPLSEAAGEWFRDIIRALFGSVVDDERAVREIFALVPKKNSKTTYGAALMITALLMNKRPRAEFLLTAPSQAISDLAFAQAAGMIDLDPDGFLQKRMHVQEHLKTITDRRTRASLKVKTFDASIVTGVKPVGILVDELHEISKSSRASRIIGQLRGGMVSNPEAFLIFITTQSDEAPSGAFKAELQMARAIRDGRIKGEMLPVLYEFPSAIARDRSDTPAWQDTKNWPMVMPNLGRSITIDRLEKDLAVAKEKGEEELRRWASQHLNIEIGIGLMHDRWSGAEFWEAQADTSLTLDEILKRSDVVVTGIDGGGLDDLLGLAVLGRDKETRDWLLWSHAWAHTSVLERRKSEAEKLRDFERAGELTISATLGEDVGGIVDIIERIEQAGLFPQECAVGVDPVGIGQIVDELATRGIVGKKIHGVSQGWRLNGAIKTAERKLADGTLHHSGLALMNWAVGNARVEARGNAISITKQAAGTAKIDPLMAAFDALALMTMNPSAAKQKSYQLIFA